MLAINEVGESIIIIGVFFMKFINLVEVNFWVILNERPGVLVAAKPPVTSCQEIVLERDTDRQTLVTLGYLDGGREDLRHQPDRQKVVTWPRSLSAGTYSEVSVVEPEVLSSLEEVGEAVVVLHRVVHMVGDSLPVGYWSGRRQFEIWEFKEERLAPPGITLRHGRSLLRIEPPIVCSFEEIYLPVARPDERCGGQLEIWEFKEDRLSAPASTDSGLISLTSLKISEGIE